jgi:predicted nucleotidyltransferase
MWGAETPESDIDTTIVYQTSARNILLNKLPKNKMTQRTIHGVKHDITEIELAHFMKNLMTHNVNYIWVVMSPLGDDPFGYKQQLQNIIKPTISKKIYKSIHGLAKHNIKHFLEHKKYDIDYKKKLNIIARSLIFGIRILRFGTFIFEPTQFKERSTIDGLMTELDATYEKSKLPEEIDTKEYEKFMINMRLALLTSRIKS